MSADSNWLEAMAALAEREEPCVMATVAEVKGSAPREIGAKMVVTRDQLFGSIGGGPLELKTCELARAMLASGEASPQLHTLALGAHLGQCCGGRVAVLLEPFNVRPRPVVAIFGSGHVGRALVAVLDGLPFKVRLIDARVEQFPATLPANVEKVECDAPADEVVDLPPRAHALVMTHSHDLDFAIIERLLRRDDLGYVGLIGSATKRRRFEQRMAAKGMSDAQISRLRCPIGIPGIAGKHPREIAIAVAAELLQLESASREAAARTSVATGR